MAKNKKHHDDVELTPEELGQAPAEKQDDQPVEGGSTQAGAWIAVRHIIASGKSYQIGEAFPADQVTEQLVKSGAIEKK